MKSATLSLAAIAMAFLTLTLSPPTLSAPPPADSSKKKPPPAVPRKHWQPDSQINPQIDYAIITEMTEAGLKLPKPSFNKPVYYISHLPPSMEQRKNGDATGGPKQVPYSFLQKQLENSLAANGYRPATAKATIPPTQVLFFEWGVCEKIEIPDTAPDKNSGNTDAGKTASTSFHDNLIARAKLIGGQKFAGEFAQATKKNDMAGFSMRDENTRTFVNAIYNGCHYLRVTSCDFEAHKRNRKKLLWITTISGPLQGVSLEASLPIMINNASYFFGRG
jgi:hypothetical protein